MKKIELIILLIFCFKSLFSQINYELLKHISNNLPDSVYSYTDIEKSHIVRAWNEFEAIDLIDKREIHHDLIIRDYYFTFNSKENDLDFYFTSGIDTCGGLFKIMSEQSQLQIKLFNCQEGIVVGVSCNSDDHASFIQDFIQFYLYKDQVFFTYNERFYGKFNFMEDNFSKATVDSIMHYNFSNTLELAENVRLIHTFTPNDTIIFSASFFDFDGDNIGKFYIDRNHLVGSMFWRKYSYKNCKLKPIGTVKKKRKAKTPLFKWE